MREEIVRLLLSHGWEMEHDYLERAILGKAPHMAYCYDRSCTFYFSTEEDNNSIPWRASVNSWQLLEWLATEPNTTPASQDAQHRES